MPRFAILEETVADLADAQHGAFTLAQLDGLCDRATASRRVREGQWHRLWRGAYALSGCLDEWTALAAMCLHTEAAVVADLAAARWWRLDGVPTGPARLVVPSTCGVRHRLLRRTDDLLTWEVRHEPGGCLRVTDPTRTLIDLGAVASAAELEVLAESALRRGLTTVPRLERRARDLQRPGRRGPAAVLAVLGRRPAGGPADSSGEVLLLQLLRAAGVPRPERQVRVGRYRFDLAWPDLRVAVELDGDHHRDRQQLRVDDRKQNEAVLAGWLVLRFTWDRIASAPEAVVEAVRAALASRAGGPHDRK